MVEEEIPPSWQVEENKMVTNDENTMVASKEKEEDQPQQFVNRLIEEHLQLILEIRQKQDDQMHSQRIIGQRMDILFDAGF
jgi:DNA-directed RNA polymerase sigma subunit (sigma70/sigma32)